MKRSLVSLRVRTVSTAWNGSDRLEALSALIDQAWFDDQLANPTRMEAIALVTHSSAPQLNATFGMLADLCRGSLRLYDPTTDRYIDDGAAR